MKIIITVLVGSTIVLCIGITLLAMTLAWKQVGLVTPYEIMRDRVGTAWGFLMATGGIIGVVVSGCCLGYRAENRQGDDCE